MRARLANILIVCARVSLLLHIVFAAANYGLTREDGIHAFNWSMGFTLALWILGCAVGGTWPRIGKLPPVVILCILGLGAFVMAGDLWDPASGDELPGPEWLSEFALRIGTFDFALSKAALIRTGVLLGAFLIALDLFASPVWTRAVLLTSGFTGVGMVVFFYLQRLVPEIFGLRALDGVTPLSFATYRYWGNAASFLNLIWPVLAGIAAQTAFSRGKGWSAWASVTLLVFAAIFLNLSKAGQALGVIGLAVFVGLSAIPLFRNRREVQRRLSLRALVAAAIPLIAILISLPFAMPWARWKGMVDTGWEGNERMLAYRLFVKLLPDAGWTGFGPGTFQTVHFQYFSEEPVMQRTPFWVAHQDYLQTVVEWGYLGTFLWGLLLVPSTLCLLGGLGRRLRFASGDESYLFGWRDRLRGYFHAVPGLEAPFVRIGLFVAILLTALHALVDFPMQIESLQFYFLIWIAAGWRLLLDRKTDPERPV